MNPWICKVSEERTGCWNEFMMNYYAFRISKRCHTHHDFLEVPLIVIPNLFRDLFFAKSGTLEDLSVPIFAYSAQPFLARGAELASPKARLARRRLTDCRRWLAFLSPSRERSERLYNALSRMNFFLNGLNCSLTVSCAPSHLWMVRLFLLRILEVMYG